MKLTVQQAAAMLNVPETAIYRWVDDEEIPFVMIHHHPRFHRLELLEWAIERELPIDVDLYEDDRDQPFTHALERGGGHMLGGSLAELASDLPVDASDREVIRAVIAAREAAMFVNRGPAGIAVPRARSPILCPEVPARVMLWWCEPARVIDHAPTHAVFLIAAPTLKQHLQLLSRLSLALHAAAFSAAVRRPGPFDQVLAEARRWEQAIEGGTR